MLGKYPSYPVIVWRFLFGISVWIEMARLLLTNWDSFLLGFVDAGADNTVDSQNL